MPYSYLSQIGFNEYLSTLLQPPTGVRTLADVIEFNRTHKEALYHGEERQNLWVILACSGAPLISHLD
jgi:hypothetical protein